MYASGWSPREIAKRLNDEGVPPSRWRAGRPNRGWAPATIHGQRCMALGILNNPVYTERVVWNRTRKVRHPDTGRRVWRPRPSEEWIFAEAPELRIVSGDLWNAVQTHRAEMIPRHLKGGAPPRYLLSGLLVCGVCGCSYSIVSGSDRYGCQGHHDRGICQNALIVRRPIIEEQVVRLVTQQMLAPAAWARFVQSFNAALKRMTCSEPKDPSRLRAVEAEVRNLVDAIAAGAGEIPEVVQRLREAKDRVAHLQAQLRPRAGAGEILRVLPDIVEQCPRDLGRLMKQDVAGAREYLRRLLRTITLQPQEGALVAIVQGDLGGILPVGNLGAGRGI